MTAQFNGTKVGKTSKRDVHRLDSRAVERLPGIQTGDSIVCTRGVLWVTQEDDPEDYVLQKSGVFVAGRQGAAVLQAFGEAEYQLSTSRMAHGWVQRIFKTSPAA